MVFPSLVAGKNKEEEAVMEHGWDLRSINLAMSAIRDVLTIDPKVTHSEKLIAPFFPRPFKKAKRGQQHLESLNTTISLVTEMTSHLIDLEQYSKRKFSDLQKITSTKDLKDLEIMITFMVGVSFSSQNIEKTKNQALSDLKKILKLFSPLKEWVEDVAL